LASEPRQKENLLSDHEPENLKDAFERAIEESETTNRYLLRLYVTGNTQKSAETILSLRKLCEEHLAGRYQLEVIDIHQQPSFARTDNIIATPTLVKQLPLPIRRMIGNLTETERVLVGLDLIKEDGDKK
jgi:circadian clock protein KaiB